MNFSVPLPNYDLLIGGVWRPASGEARTFPSLNPYTGEAWATIAESTPQDVDDAVAAARNALNGVWGEMNGFQRAKLMRRLCDILSRDAAQLAVLESRDNGKLLRETSAQTASLSEWLYYFAGVADKFQGEVIPPHSGDLLIYTRHEPIGVVAAITAWNSPMALLMWKLAPLLAAGCTVGVRPSVHIPVTALEIGKRFQEAGFPPGVFNPISATQLRLNRAQ